MSRIYKIPVILPVLLIVVNVVLPRGVKTDSQPMSSMTSLLPEFANWEVAEVPETYFPENLFEYINGAAEVYLTYDFQELIVAEYNEKESSSNVALEIYDMGTAKNAFGIYSAERFPDNQFIQIGSQGYCEEGVLNFLIDRYYIKLLCFDCGNRSEEVLLDFSKNIASRVEGTAGFPVLVNIFPEKGLMENTEKFIFRNFMGYGFLHDGYSANYRVDGEEFDCFFIEGKNGEEAESMLKHYLDAKKNGKISKAKMGFHFKDKYYHNIYIVRVGRYLCGVMKIKDGSEKLGKEYLALLVERLKNL